jgi:hypothetical protein
VYPVDDRIINEFGGFREIKIERGNEIISENLSQSTLSTTNPT